MRTKFSPFRFVFVVLCALTLLGLPARGQEKEKAEAAKVHHHEVQDWSRHHALYPRFGPINRLIEVQKDPRAIEAWQASFRKDFHRGFRRQWHRNWGHNHVITHADWSISLGAGSMAAAMYPAKWTFDSNETVTGPGDANSCLNDYIAFTVDVAGGAGQPNIVGLNNLYSGNAGASGNGVCNRTASGTDDGLSATTLFSYAVIADDGVVATSPTTSMDGTKIAFVEGTTTAAHFHVLAWNAGDGNNDTVSRQDAVTNALNITTFTGGTPTAGTATDLALGATDTLSSPFVEYSADVAYVGDDAGVIYKIKNVFCPAWAPCGGAAPSLDTSFGTGGSVTIGGTCTGMVTGVVADGPAGNIFVGCADGKLYGFTPTGTPITGSPLAVGDGVAGIVDPPMLDVVNGFIYVETGSGSVTHTPILMQASVSNLGTNSTADLSPGGLTTIFNLHAPAFNDAYFTDANPAHWFLYEYSSDNSGGTPEIALYGITFNSSHVMTSGVPANVIPFTGLGANEISPLTEFLTTGGEDRIFASALLQTTGNLLSFDVNDLVTNPPDGFPSTFENFASEASGTTGMVIDNVQSAVGQSNSIYFGTLGGTTPNPNSAVKLTQVDLM